MFCWGGKEGEADSDLKKFGSQNFWGEEMLWYFFWMYLFRSFWGDDLQIIFWRGDDNH